MGTTTRPANGTLALSEMREFASFTKGTQRYIRRSLDVGLDRRDAVECWSRDIGEAAGIRAQQQVYRRLAHIRTYVPDDCGIDRMEPLMAPLVTMTAFDLGQDRLTCFASYRFLYERLVGAGVRPWLPAAFCSAAALPHLHPQRRRALLQTISEAAATAPGWSSREPMFVPDWVEKVDLAAAA